MWRQIAADITAYIGQPFRIKNRQIVSGGCINTTVKISAAGFSFFVKTNQTSAIAMFSAEAAGLQQISASKTIRVPQVIACNSEDMGENTGAYLILEFINLIAGSAQDQRKLGEQLARMHRHTRTKFGWHRDNTLGSTTQINTEETHWSSFWAKHRLEFQLQLAAQNGYNGELLRKGARCVAAVPQWLRGHQPQPSLLHGDLWSGNYGFVAEGLPVIYDPAVYYGDRETDIAMTELFGGFSRDFYAAYNDHWPLHQGYHWRKTLYNLYHILNHLNLFGDGYLTTAIDAMDKLLTQSA